MLWTLMAVFIMSLITEWSIHPPSRPKSHQWAFPGVYQCPRQREGGLEKIWWPVRVPTVPYQRFTGTTCTVGLNEWLHVLTVSEASAKATRLVYVPQGWTFSLIIKMNYQGWTFSLTIKLFLSACIIHVTEQVHKTIDPMHTHCWHPHNTQDTTEHLMTFVKELRRANSALVDAFEKSKKRQQAEKKRMKTELVSYMNRIQKGTGPLLDVSQNKLFVQWWTWCRF